MKTHDPFTKGLLDALKPRPRLTMSQWAEENIYLSPERSFAPGPFRIGDAAYQRGMMDAISDPSIHTVVYMTSSQVGKTTFLAAAQGYFCEGDPAPQLCVLPTQIMADAYAVETFTPIVRDSPSLRAVHEAGGKQTANFRQYPGGYITFVGANTPAQLSMRPIRVVTGDEIDRWPVSSGREGSPLDLAMKRTTTFANRKVIWSSTPVLKATSAILRQFNMSDERYFHVVCPDCGHKQPLVWENVHYKKGDEGKATYHCAECGAGWDELTKRSLVRHAEAMGGGWIATAVAPGVAGFHVGELYSPWSSMAKMARRWEASRGKPEEEQTFQNTVLGLPWEGDIGSYADVDVLRQRQEPIAPNILPPLAGLVTAGVDVQPDRLEVTYVAWGQEDESWIIDHIKIPGDVTTQNVWRRLEEALRRQFSHKSGKALTVEAAAIDSGGTATQKVYDFAASAMKRGYPWYAIKGVPGEKKPIWQRSEARIKNGVKLYLVGVDDGKTNLYQRYGILVPGPGFVHVPDRFGEEELKQMTAERAVVDYINGFPVRTWEKDRSQRNELLDCLVYAYAAQRSLNLDMPTRLKLLYANEEGLDAQKVGEMYR